MKGAEIDFNKFMKQKEDIVSNLTGGIEFLFKKNKVDYVKGWGRFASQGQLEVDLL